MDVKNKKIRLVYGILLGVLTAAVALAFLVAAADIYYGGPDPAGHNYTYAALKSHLVVPLSLMGVWIAAIVGGFIVSVLLPVSESRRPRADEKLALARLKKRLPTEGGEDFAAACAKIRFHENLRMVLWCFALAVCLVGAIYGLVYVFTPSNYSSADFNGDILRMVKNVMPWVGIALVLCIAAQTAEIFSVRAELKAAKLAIRTGEAESVLPPAEKKQIDPKRLRAAKLTVQIAVIAIAVALIVAGIVNGGAGSVLAKATDICTECIGLG